MFVVRQGAREVAVECAMPLFSPLLGAILFCLGWGKGRVPAVGVLVCEGASLQRGKRGRG